MVYKVYSGKCKDKIPYTICAKNGRYTYIDGLKNVKAFCGGKLYRLKSGIYWTVSNDIEYYIESEETR